jgi:hypothetical protein
VTRWTRRDLLDRLDQFDLLDPLDRLDRLDLLGPCFVLVTWDVCRQPASE